MRMLGQMAGLHHHVGSYLLLLVVTLGQSLQRIHSTGLREYCETELFSAICAKDEVLILQVARYGRMRLGRCVRKDLGYIGCYQDVLNLADHRCSGRQQCQIRIPDPTFDTTRPCLEELKTYFEASYICQKVWLPASDKCDQHRLVLLEEPTGYLASSVSMSTGCGTPNRPFLLRAQAGQKINITLMDFFVGSSKNTQDSKEDSCRVYAVIEDPPTQKRHTICGGRERVRHEYTSSNNTLEIRIIPTHGKNDAHYFLLQWQALGCPDFVTPENMYMQRTADGAVVGCHGSSQSWHLKCIGTTWTGMIGNCSHYALVEPEQGPPPAARMGYGTSVAIIFVIAFIIGVTVFIIGFVAFKRCRRRPRPDHRTLRKPHPHQELELQGKVKVMAEHQCSQAGHAHFHHAHKHMLKLDSSDYAHIWESPVPLPMTMPIEHSINHHLTHAQLNSEGDRARPQSDAVFKEAAHTLDIIRDSLCDNCEHGETIPRAKRKDAKSGYSYETPRYFVLERDMMMHEGGAEHCGHDHHEHAQTLPLKQPSRGDTPMSPVAMCTERERPELRSFKQ